MRQTYLDSSCLICKEGRCSSQVPSCPLRQVVLKPPGKLCEYGRLLPTEPLISLTPAIDFVRRTLKAARLSTGQAYLIARLVHHYRDSVHRIAAMASPTGTLAESYSLHPYHRRFAAHTTGNSDPEDP